MSKYSGQTVCSRCGRKVWMLFRSSDTSHREGICGDCRNAEKG
jgi:DNA-directed RNA polymerase subunit RPC12/RpoP